MLSVGGLLRETGQDGKALTPVDEEIYDAVIRITSTEEEDLCSIIATVKC